MLQEDNFNQEVAALKRIRRLHDPHLIELLGTYKWNGFYHLIFRYAEGDLKKFWMDNPSRNFGPTLNTWVLDQCLGVAQGLGLFHNELAGRHGDIKPENILHYVQGDGPQDSELGVLKISDFGLAEFHGNNTHPKKSVPVTQAYRPPEHDLQGEVSSASDIWSLGCVYLEFVTWVLQDGDGVTQFLSERKSDDSQFYPEEEVEGEGKFFNVIEPGSSEARLKASLTTVR